jgi:hypothetical protein
VIGCVRVSRGSDRLALVRPIRLLEEERRLMGRMHLLELEDQTWFPDVFRQAGMAYLRFAAETTGQAEHILPVIETALERSGESAILDLCSGGAGPVLSIAEEFEKKGTAVEVTLTDRFPDEGTRELIESRGLRGVRYEPEPVDAFEVDGSRAGLRTLFNGFHHFRRADAVRVLSVAVESRRSIAVVEVVRRNPLIMFGMLFAPFMVLAVVPFLRPFKFAWIPFTYLIPVIPLFVLWDGMVSCLRVYSPDELRELTAEADPGGEFDWQIEPIPMAPQPVPGLALIGVPRKAL